MSSKILLEKPDNTNLITLSVSKIKTFESCKAKYKYSYIDHLPQKDFDFLTLGKFLHEILEHFHQNIIEGDTDPNNIIMTKVYKNAYENWKDKLTEDQKIECRAILNNYLKLLSEQRKVNKILNVLSVEKKFLINVNDKALITGVIDRVQLDADGIVHIADYKSSKNDRYLKNDLFQLNVYAFATLLENPDLQKIRTSYILLKHNFQAIVKEFNKEEILKVEDKFIKTAVEITEEKLFRPTVSPLCAYCPFLQSEELPQGCRDGRDYLDRKAGISKIGAIEW